MIIGILAVAFNQADAHYLYSRLDHIGLEEKSISETYLSLLYTHFTTGYTT